MNWYLVSDVRGPILNGTHREMWEALRQLSAVDQSTHYVASIETSHGLPIIMGGTREIPAERASNDMFPGARKCVRQHAIRTNRQQARLSLHQYQPVL